MQQFLIFTIAGLSSAGIYAISASGLTLKYSTTGVFDWSHGATGMVAAFAYWQLRFDWGWPAPVAFVVCLAVLAPTFGLMLERLAMSRLRGASETTQLVSTLAIALVLVGIVQTVWDPDEFRSARPLYSGQVVDVGGVRIAYNDAIVLVVAALVAVGLRAFMFNTRAGVSMRAAVDDAALAALSGAAPRRAAAGAWMLGSGLAVLAGILVAPTLSLSAIPLTLLIVNGYAAAVIGRLRSVPWTFAGAIVLGLSIGYVVGYAPRIDTGAQYLRGVAGAIPAIVLVVALLVMPRPHLRGHRVVRFREVASVPSWRGTAAFGIGVIALALVLTTVMSDADLFSSTGIWGIAIVGLSLIPLAGYSGRLSLCQLTFAAIGTIVVSHTGSSSPLVLLVAGAVCAVVGMVVALPALRLSGLYLALATGAFAIVMDNWVFNLPSFTLFGREVWIWKGGTLTVSHFELFGLDLSSTTATFLSGAVAFVAMAAVVTAIRRSTLGLRLLALKDSEAAYATLGLNRQAGILAVFGIAAAMAGIGGGLYGAAIQSASPSRFNFVGGLTLLLVMVVGGIRTPAAAVLAGIYIGSPLLTGLFPGAAAVPTIVIGVAAITLGRHPDGLFPVASRELLAITRRPALAAALALGLVGVWWARLSGAVTVGQWLIGSFAVIVLVTIVPRLTARFAATRSSVRDGRVTDGGDPLTAPPEALGWLAPFTDCDVATLDRVVGLRRLPIEEAQRVS